jgi:4-carboxymuconolactone decarboxylase
MTDAQRRAANELTAGPRGGVKGPFIPLLRSPELMDRLQKVGEYLRYHSFLDVRISEFAMLLVSRHWTQQFEWATHVPLALKAGLRQEHIDAIAEGRRPVDMSSNEEVAYDLVDEVLTSHGVCDATYQRAMASLGESGIIDLLGVVGYFTTVSMVLNVAHTPAESTAVPPLVAFPR